METELIVILNDGDWHSAEGCYVAEVTSEGIDEACGSGTNAIPEDAIIREVSIRRLMFALSAMTGGSFPP